MRQTSRGLEIGHLLAYILWGGVLGLLALGHFLAWPVGFDVTLWALAFAGLLVLGLCGGLIWRRLFRLQRVSHYCQKMAHNNSLDEVLKSAKPLLDELIVCDGYFIGILSYERGTLIRYGLIVWQGVQQPDLIVNINEGCVVQRALQENDSHWYDQCDQLPMFSDKGGLHILAMPIKTQAGVVGVLGVVRRQAYSYDESVLYGLEGLSRQVGFAIERERFAATRSQWVKKLEMVNQTFNDSLLDTDINTSFRNILYTAMHLVDADVSAIYTRNRASGDMQLVLAQNIGGDFRKSYATLDDAMQKTRIIADISAETDADVMAFAQIAGVQAFIAVRLWSAETPTGILIVGHKQPYQYQVFDLDLMRVLTHQVSVALENTELVNALEIYATEMAQLVYLSRTSLVSLQPEEVASQAVMTLQQMFHVDAVSILGLQAGGNGQDMIQVLGATPTVPNAIDHQWLSLYPELLSMRRKDSRQRLLLSRKSDNLSGGVRQLMWQNEYHVLAIIALKSQEQVFGFMLLGALQERVFDNREWQFIETAANLLATQIQNAQLYNSTREALMQRLEQLSFIETLVQQISQALDIDLIIQSIMRAARQVTHADIVRLLQRRSSGEYRVIEHTYDAQGNVEEYTHETTQLSSAVLDVLDSGETLLSPAYGLPENDDTPMIGRYPSVLAVPLVEEQVPIGVLLVESENRNFFTREQANYLQNLAGHTVISLANARNLAQRQRQIETLTSLRQLSLRVVGIDSLETVFSQILETSVQLFGCDAGAMYHYDRLLRDFSLVSHTHNESGFPALEHTIALQAMDGQRLRISQLQHHGQLYTQLFVPVIRGDATRELLALIYEGRHQVSTQDLEAIDLLVNQAASHIETAALYEQIRSASNRMRTILQSTSDGILLLDREERLLEFNTSAEYLLDMSLQAHLNQPYDTMPLPAEPIPQELPEREQLHAGALMRPLGRFELAYDASNGRMRYVEQTVLPVYDDGVMIGKLLVLRDVTEEHELERYRNEITFMLVHDLRSPLGSVIAGLDFAKELLDELEDVGYLTEILDVAYSSSNRLLTLINTLLDVEREQMQTTQVELSVQHLVDSAVLELEQTAKQADVSISVDVSTNVSSVYVDEEKIQRVLINLIDNAIDYSHHAVSVTASVGDEGWVMVRVMDDGDGIPAEMRQTIFNKFSQGKGQEKRRGKHSGIGLAYCRRAVDAHGGKIWVADESDTLAKLSGACFVFTLPVYVPDEDEQ